ncbi:MAG: flagellar hook-basal body complex protein FliE [Myxococcota bacterium]
MENVLVQRLQEITPALNKGPAEGVKESTGGRFANMMSDLLGEVNAKQNTAESNAVGLAKGEVDIMDAVVSLNEADLSLRMMMQIRDRAVDSYQRVLRTI